jgi:RNA polymerase sigma-70 factor (ECF subfamily)
MRNIAETATIDLETLWHQYCCRLEAFIRSRVSDEGDVEDLLQEIFIRIHTHLSRLRDLSKLESWIYQITRNAIIDYYRLRRPTVELSESLPIEDEFEQDDATARLALSLGSVIEELPAPYRQALILTEYQGLNQRQLADRLGISFSGAKTRVQRARHMLRDMLLTCCHFELDRRGAIIDFYQRCCCCNPSG